MPKYEYKVVPVPTACDRRARTDRNQDPAAATIEAQINGLTIEGWEYVRTDRMSLNRPGPLSFGRKITREMMIFRKEPFALRQEQTSAPATDRVHLKVERLTSRVAPRRIGSMTGEARSAIAAE